MIAQAPRPAVSRSRGHGPRPSLPGLLLLGLLACVPCADAFTIEHSESHYADKQYHYELIAVLDAPVERVQAVLRDYAGYPALDSRILQARVLARPADHVVVLQTMLRVCFGPFCRNVRRVERVEESPRELFAVTDPARSDVKFGEARTQLSAAAGGGTLVEYRNSVVPGFWVPALVGRRWLLHALAAATSELFENVEARAQREEMGEESAANGWNFKR